MNRKAKEVEAGVVRRRTAVLAGLGAQGFTLDPGLTSLCTCLGKTR